MAVTAVLGGATAACHVRSFRLLEDKHVLALPPPPPPPAVSAVPAAPPVKKWTLYDVASPDWLHWLAAIVGTLGDALVSLLIPSRLGGIIAALASPAGPSAADFAVLGGLLVAKAALHFATTVEVRAACEGFAARLKVSAQGCILFVSFLFVFPGAAVCCAAGAGYGVV